uniref:FAD:protein FMN transferase n=1 Tax=Magnetococcus massalia (strain MO-1) TaxID=451514 RepID=A0A1S7LLL6_MAGMO|nr:putative thiamine biosynthesis lipoprotein apbE [Candidatus Magnetococcus massalia]
MMQFHHRFKGLIVALLTAFLLTGCLERPVKTTQLRMGTWVQITTMGEHTAAVKAAYDEMGRIEQLMSRHLEKSAVAAVNHAPRGTWQPLDREIYALVARGLEVQKKADGSFHMGLEPLIRNWKFSAENPPTTPPPAEQISAWVETAKPLLEQAIHLQEVEGSSQIKLQHRVFGLDLGAIAKGYAIDRAVQILQKHGVKDAIVNAGGDLRTLGNRSGSAWRIGIRDPRDPRQVVVKVELDGNHAMVTSGDYERFFLHDGKRYHHLLNPKTGYPMDQGWVSISVQAESAEIADALSTALFGLSQQAGTTLLKESGGAEALWIHADGSHQQTPGFIGEWLSKQP